MKTLIFAIPETLQFDLLTPEQQDAINSVIGCWVDIGKPFGGQRLIDVIVNDNYTEAARLAYFPDWQVMLELDWTGGYRSTVSTELDPVTGAPIILTEPDITVHVPLDAAYVNFVPSGREVNVWAGWPGRF